MAQTPLPMSMPAGVNSIHNPSHPVESIDFSSSIVSVMVIYIILLIFFSFILPNPAEYEDLVELELEEIVLEPQYRGAGAEDEDPVELELEEIVLEPQYRGAGAEDEDPVELELEEIVLEPQYRGAGAEDEDPVAASGNTVVLEPPEQLQPLPLPAEESSQFP